MIVLVMVAQMILLQPTPHAALHRKMMSGIMDCVITDIAESKSRQSSWRETAHGYKKNRVKYHRERNTDNRWHNEAGCIIRIIVMNTMHNEVEQFAPASLWLVMENVAMNHVLQQRPCQHAHTEECGNHQDRQVVVRKRQIQHQGDDRTVEHHRRRRMHM